MTDRERQLREAAMQYQMLRDDGQSISIEEFVQSVDPELRADLSEDLHLLVALGDVPEPLVVAPADQARIDRALQRSDERIRQRLALPASNLTELRRARKLTLRGLARYLDLPEALLHRLESGSVRAASIPEHLLATLAALLERTEAEVVAALAGPQATSQAVRLSAQDGTVVQPQDLVDFAEALVQSGASDAQQERWR